MLFTIQAYLEDYLSGRNISDADGFAVKLANLYFHKRGDLDEEAFLRKVSRIRTVLFARNAINNRSSFERTLLVRLDRQFKKKLQNKNLSFTGGISNERRRISRLPRRTINAIVSEFKEAVEARAIDAFWQSRKRGELRNRPEKIAQSLFAVFTKGVLRDSRVILREIGSGIGFVDIGIVLSRILHLIEIKILKGRLEGPNQLEEYMKIEGRSEGTLVVIDPFPKDSKIEIPEKIMTPTGLIKVSVVDINPQAPSKNCLCS